MFYNRGLDEVFSLRSQIAIRLPSPRLLVTPLRDAPKFESAIAVYASVSSNPDYERQAGKIGVRLDCW